MGYKINVEWSEMYSFCLQVSNVINMWLAFYLIPNWSKSVFPNKYFVFVFDEYPLKNIMCRRLATLLEGVNNQIFKVFFKNL